MIIVYSLIYTITRQRDDSFKHLEENLKGKPKDENEENTWL